MNKLLPREKIIIEGPKKLLDSELIAIMLGTGTKEVNVFELAERISKEIGLERLMDMSFNELKNIRGVGKAKATKLLACFEIAKRYMVKKNEASITRLLTSKDAYEYVKNDYLLMKYETVIAIYVDAKLGIIKKAIYEEGDEARRTIFPIRKIIKHAIDYSAYGIFLFHNHPTGDSSPSQTDIDVTEDFNRILANVGVVLLDHIIVGKNEYFSFAEQKYL